jgi:hypothetical protein
MVFYGTIKPKGDFDPDTEADRLHKAMKGIGCNKDEVVRVLTHLSNAQRQMVILEAGERLVEECKISL